MAQIQMALLGTGRWGQHLLRNFLHHPQVEVRAVVDANGEQLESVAARFRKTDLLDPSIPLLTDANEAFALEGLEAVSIATPAATHYSLVTSAFEKDLHVLVEKPLTLNSIESTELCRTADERGRRLVVDHTYLFNPVVEAGRNVVQQERLGALRYGYAARTNLGPIRSDVDALWDLAIHDIAIFNNWLGETPLRVHAHGQGWLQQEANIAPHFPSGLSDVVWCRLVYPSGFEATIHVSWANPHKQRRLSVVGESGSLTFDEMDPENPLTLNAGKFDRESGHFIPKDIENTSIVTDSSEPLGNLCNHFVDCVVENKESEVSSGRIGTDLVRVLEALSLSLNARGQWFDVATGLASQ